MRRRLFCLLPIALLAACDEQPATPTQPEAPDVERVYSPGPIAWEQLSDEHRRRARMMLARHQEAVPEDEEALRARWNAMSPAQQRFAIRAPRRMAPPRDNHARRTTRGSTTRSSTSSHGSTSRSSTSTRSSSSSSSSRSGSSSSSSSRSGSSTQRLPTPPSRTPPRDQR